MAAGKAQSSSPIIEAIRLAESGTTGEIRVHLSRRWGEKDAIRRAHLIFDQFKMAKTAQRNAVLLYINLRRRIFAIVGDEGIHRTVGQNYWNSLRRELKDNLMSTHPEKAIALAVVSIGEVLAEHFPLEGGEKRVNQLSNEISED